jgi:uncharacterized membrane protein
MNLLLVAYAISLPLFVGIDMLWLLGPGRPIYVSEIGTLMRATPNIPAAMAFYLLYCVGLVYFAVSGALHGGSALPALAQGALFGLVAYATYDLTNLAVISGFTTKIAIMDMAWGSILSGIVAWAVTKICLMIA